MKNWEFFQLANSPIHQVTNSPIHQLTNSPTHEFTNSPIEPGDYDAFTRASSHSSFHITRRSGRGGGDNSGQGSTKTRAGRLHRGTRRRGPAHRAWYPPGWWRDDRLLVFRKGS